MLEDVLDTFRRWLYLPDPSALYVALATVAANRFEDRDPLWLALVGPPGGGKSEIIVSLYGLEGVEPVGTLTEPALLSGTPRKDQAPDAKGGILRKIGAGPGIIACKDFGSILDMHPEKLRFLLAALREVYDGSWVRDLGIEGHRKLHWEGKVGLIAGVTPVIDRHHGAMSAMGERLIFLRLPRVDPKEQGRRAWAIGGSEVKMRAELRAAVTEFFSAPRADPEPTSPEQGDRLVDLAMLVTRCRSAVMRHNYSREIELIPEAEAPTRLVGQLDRMFTGLRAIGCSTPEAWRITVRVGLDSMPVLRRITLEALLQLEELTLSGESVTIAQILGVVEYPKRTVERTLEDLAGHHVVYRHSHGQGKATTYELNHEVAVAYRGLRAEDDGLRAEDEILVRP